MQGGIAHPFVLPSEDVRPDLVRFQHGYLFKEPELSPSERDTTSRSKEDGEHLNDSFEPHGIKDLDDHTSISAPRIQSRYVP